MTKKEFINFCYETKDTTFSIAEMAVEIWEKVLVPQEKLLDLKTQELIKAGQLNIQLQERIKGYEEELQDSHNRQEDY